MPTDHEPVARYARPSEGGEGFVCKVCGKPVSVGADKKAAHIAAKGPRTA